MIGAARLENVHNRFSSLVQIHEETLDFYLLAVKAINDEKATGISSDGRPRSLVVAHIMGWEDWQNQVFSASNRMKRIREQMKFKGYYDSDKNKRINFNGVNGFFVSFRSSNNLQKISAG